MSKPFMQNILLENNDICVRSWNCGESIKITVGCDDIYFADYGDFEILLALMNRLKNLLEE